MFAQHLAVTDVRPQAECPAATRATEQGGLRWPTRCVRHVGRARQRGPRSGAPHWCARHGAITGGESPPRAPAGGNRKRMAAAPSKTSSRRWGVLPVRGCGMEASSEAQHRTRVNSGAGFPVWVSGPMTATPGIQSRQAGSRSGGGAKWSCLTLGDLDESAGRGRREPMLVEESDRLIVVMKPGNSGGAKGATG